MAISGVINSRDPISSEDQVWYRAHAGGGGRLGHLTASTDYSQFDKPLDKDQEILHALNRLTFGPRPGDVEAVRKMGLKKWIDQQLHPERIAENPEVAERLQPLESLHMSPAEIATNYPPPAAGPGHDERAPAAADRIRRRGREWSSRISACGPSRKPRDDGQAKAKQQGKGGDPLQQAMRQQVLATADPVERRKLVADRAPQQVLPYDLNEAKLYRAIYSNRQLEEQMADFWFNHFNVYMDKGADRILTSSYERDAIRPHVFGKFRDLLEATAESPAMLFYLDNWQSVSPDRAAGWQSVSRKQKAKQSRGLNENYARELMELHTLGVDGGYTQTRRHRSSALLHRMDHHASRIAAANSFTTTASTTKARKPCWA